MYMKILTFLACALCSIAAAAQPQIKWIETEHDFGAFSEEVGMVGTTFRYVNVGNEPLVIVGARANCGCTTPRFSLEPLAPGDTAQLEVKYDAVGRPGRFAKKIFVDTNTEPVRTTLTVRGVVVGATPTVAQRYPVSMGKISLMRAYAMLGEVKKSHLKVEMLSAYNCTTDSLTPAVVDLPKWLTVSCTPSPVAPGEQMSFNFMVHADRTPLYGVVTDTVTIVPDTAEPQTRFKLPVVVTINEDFSRLSDADIAKSPQATLINERVDMGKIARGETITARYELRNDGKTPLLVRRIYSADHDVNIAVSSEKIKPGKKATITATYTPRADEQIVNIKINLITNDPLTPTQALRLTAEM
jgi:hypothetical protein